MEALVLNAAAVPVSVVPWRRAISLVYTGKAITLEQFDGTVVRSSSYVTAIEGVTRSRTKPICMQVPSVIQCIHSNYVPKTYTDVLPFNRRNVFIRDRGHCMYCGRKVSLSSFTFDHVTPRSLGGTTCWENVVISCSRCNLDKGSKPLHRFKRRLLRKPFAPRLDKAAPAHLVSIIAAEIPHQTWSDYIYWNVILEP